jgi:hypothetical protein
MTDQPSPTSERADMTDETSSPSSQRAARKSSSGRTSVSLLRFRLFARGDRQGAQGERRDRPAHARQAVDKRRLECVRAVCLQAKTGLEYFCVSSLQAVEIQRSWTAKRRKWTLKSRPLRPPSPSPAPLADRLDQPMASDEKIAPG